MQVAMRSRLRERYVGRRSVALGRLRGRRPGWAKANALPPVDRPVSVCVECAEDLLERGTRLIQDTSQ
eukprot:SAG31_NODE_19269_length_607_cov_1.496063_2_plen_67_part_01